MENKGIFPQIKGIAHGGDYNPEQWLDRPDILEKDIELMKKAGITEATLGVFSWTTYEPNEGEYHFEWLKERMDTLYANGIHTILATPSGARPAWLDLKYEEAMRVDAYGIRNHHGVRHNHCLSSPIYREKVAKLLRELIKAVGNHPGLMMWHISNEFGGECYCPLCAKRFQNYLAEEFDHDIERLNHAWWTTFWSHRYRDFSEIEPPYSNGEDCTLGLNLEWKRFTTWNFIDYLRSEIDVLRELTPDIPVTTNYMQFYWGIDYRKMSPHLDVISWDSYPRFHNDYESFSDTIANTSFDHSLMRSMKKDKPFILMESAPGLVNWQEFNKMRRPGVHRLASYQAIACGSDTVMYFQWRKGRGSSEQFHGAVVDHVGTGETRVFKEVERLGVELNKLGCIKGSLAHNKVAMIVDWDNRWAIDDMRGMAQSTKHYEETCMEIYREFLKLGVDVDIIGSGDDFEDYDILLAPMLYMVPEGLGNKLKTFVAEGGQLFATYLTGYVDKDTLNHLGGYPGDGLMELFGMNAEELDTLYPTDRNEIHFPDYTVEVYDYAEYINVIDAKVLGTFGSDYYKDRAAVTVKDYGKGKAYYYGARVSGAAMMPIFKEMLANTTITVHNLPAGVELHSRYSDNEVFDFYLNTNSTPVCLHDLEGYDLITEQKVTDVLSLDGYGVAIIKR